MYKTRLIPFKKILIIALGACMICVIAAFAQNKDVVEVPSSTAESYADVDATPSLLAVELPTTPVPFITDPSVLAEQTEGDTIDPPENEELVEPEVDPNPYATLALTESEKELLARMAYSEAGNQSFDGQVAVVQVALNRYMHDAYSGSISDILFAPYQFAVGSHYGPTQMEAVEAALAGEPALDLNTDVVYFSTGSLTYGSYYKTIGAHVFRTYS